MKYILIFLFISYSAFSQDPAKPDRDPRSQYSPLQDSAYKEALKENIPVSQRIRETLGIIDILILQNSKPKSNWEIARNNLNQIPSEYYNADPVEVVNREIMFQQSQYAPFVRSYSQYGAKISMSEVMNLLGFNQDFSPNISYELDHHSKVKIVIYSIQAVAIATIFEGIQEPGSYTKTWNQRDDNGRFMPPGEYVAEVKIDNRRLVMKSIIIN